MVSNLELRFRWRCTTVQCEWQCEYSVSNHHFLHSQSMEILLVPTFWIVAIPWALRYLLLTPKLCSSHSSIHLVWDLQLDTHTILDSQTKPSRWSAFTTTFYECVYFSFVGSNQIKRWAFRPPKPPLYLVIFRYVIFRFQCLIQNYVCSVISQNNRFHLQVGICWFYHATIYC